MNKQKMLMTTPHNHMLHTLISCDIYQNNNVEFKATSWPWKQLMKDLKIDLEQPRPHHCPLPTN